MDKRNCQYICEREWFRKQYEKEIGKPPREENMKLTDITNELKMKAKQRNVVLKGLVDKVDLQPNVAELKWSSPTVRKCSCPMMKCICKGSSNVRPANYIMEGTKYERKTLKWQLRRLMFWRPMESPIPARTFIPRFLAAANMEALLTTASLKRHSFSELQPEYCMSGCMHFYLGQKLLEEKQQLMKEEQQAHQTQSELEIGNSDNKGNEVNILTTKSLSNLLIVKDTPGLRHSMCEDFYGSEFDQVDQPEEHYIEVVDDKHYSVSVQTKFDYKGNYKQEKGDKVMYTSEQLHVVKDILGTPLEMIKHNNFKDVKDIGNEKRQHGGPPIFYVSTAVKELKKNVKKIYSYSPIGRSTTSTGTLCSLGKDTYQNRTVRRTVTAEELFDMKYPATSSLGTETLRPNISEKTSATTTTQKKNNIRSGVSRVSFSLVDSPKLGSENSLSKLAATKIDKQTMNTTDTGTDCIIFDNICYNETKEETTKYLQQPISVNVVTSQSQMSLNCTSCGASRNTSEKDDDKISTTFSRILQSNLRRYSGLKNNLSKIGKDMFSLFSDVIVKQSVANENEANLKLSRAFSPHRCSPLKIISSSHNIGTKTDPKSSFSLCKIVSSITNTGDNYSQNVDKNRTIDKKIYENLENQYNVLNSGLPYYLNTHEFKGSANHNQKDLCLSKLLEPIRTMSRSTLTHTCKNISRKHVATQRKSHFNGSKHGDQFNIATCIIMHDPYQRRKNSLIIDDENIKVHSNIITKNSVEMQYDTTGNTKTNDQMQESEISLTKISNDMFRKLENTRLLLKKFSESSMYPSMDTDTSDNITDSEIYHYHNDEDISESEHSSIVSVLNIQNIKRSNTNSKLVDDIHIRTSNIDTIPEIEICPSSKIEGVASTPDCIPVNTDNQLRNMSPGIKDVASKCYQEYLKYPDIILNSKENFKQ